jgi:hypothetical protein
LWFYYCAIQELCYSRTTLRHRCASFITFVLAVCVFLCGLPTFGLDGQDVHTYGYGDKAELPLHASALVLAPVLNYTLKLEPRRLLSAERQEPLILGKSSSSELLMSLYLQPLPPFLWVSLLSTKA